MDQKRRSVLKSAAMAGLGITTISNAQSAAPLADWLVLVYMNGKNDLAPFAIQDFEEMAKVGSNKRLHVVVELGRPADPNYNGDRYGGWSGVKRFYIKPKMTPDEKNAVLHVAAAAAPAGDMGSPQVLDDFISWGAKNYPAKKKMLVIWNHGQGWRLILSAAAAASATARTARVERLDDARGLNTGTYRSVSSDSDHRSILYNKQVQTVLEAQAANGTRFDVVAYDACLMAMIETAYSLRKCTDVLVASEELEPGTGWDHTLVLSKLVAAPALTPEALGKAIVTSYQERYGNGDMTTLSALRMAGIDAASAAISRTAAQLLASKNRSFPELRKVRDSMFAFADYRNIGFAVDAQTLFERIAANCTHPGVKAEASATVQALKAMVISNYASNSTADYGPQGLAIYFPHSRTKFESDRDGQGYLRSNTIHPVDFVRDNEWAVLLREFLQLPA